jgi:uncharacterized protein YjbI with pentapeptide repeats
MAAMSDDLVEALRRGEGLKGAELRGIRLHQLDLSGANLEGADLAEATIENVNFDGANLAGARFTESVWTSVTARNARLDRANLELSALRGVDFTDASLVSANLSRTTIDNVRFVRSALDRATLSMAKIRSLTLQDTSLARTWLLGFRNLDPEIERALAGAGGSVVTIEGVIASLARMVPRIRRPQRTPAASFEVQHRNVDMSQSRMSGLGVAALVAGLLVALGAVLGVAAMGYQDIARRFAGNRGLPVSETSLQRLDDNTFMYLERGTINILKWDGKDLSLTKRYQIQYDEPQNFFFLDEAQQRRRVPSR